jgi:peptidyl-Lys metalloendopeptidase
MMRLITAFLLLLLAQPAWAEATPGCTGAQAGIARKSLDDAKRLTLTAAATIADDASFARWFGAYSPAAAEEVRANLKAIAAAFRRGSVVMQCQTRQDDGCTAGEYAWVYPFEPYRIYLCPSFFTLPDLATLRPDSYEGETGTREGTLVHEISHFNTVARTDDHCYTRSECSAMAQRDAIRARANADSYQYYIEDMAIAARAPVAGKDAP